MKHRVKTKKIHYGRTNNLNKRLNDHINIYEHIDNCEMELMFFG